MKALVTIAAAAAILAAATVATTNRSGATDAPRARTASAVSSTAITDLTRPFVTGSFTKRWAEGRFLRRKSDDAGHVSYVIGSLKVAPPARPWVALVGGSNVRECVQRPADLTAALDRLTGTKVRTVVLGSTNQNLGETMAIVENLPPAPGVVVIAVNHTRFAYPADTVARQIQGTTLLMPSDALWEFVAAERGTAPENTIAPGIRAYMTDLRRRHAAARAAGTTYWHDYLMHRYNAEHIWAQAKKRSRVRLWLEGRGAPGGQFDRSSEFNTRALAAVVALAEARGYEVVLMEAPADEAVIRRSFDRYRAVYVPACESMAAESGGLYVNLNRSASLTSADFRDLTHLVGRGRTKWTAALASALAPVVTGMAAPGADPSPGPSIGP